MGTENEGSGEANAASASDPKKDSLYEDRPGSKKIIRVVTVIAYMVSVSFVAIVLSGYYVFLWQPPNPRLLHRDHLRSDPQVEYLIDKPPMEIAINESLSPTEIRDKVNFFRQEILRTRGVNVSLQSHSESVKIKTISNKVNQVENFMTNRTERNNSQTQFNPIVRGLFGNNETSTSQTTLRRSTDVYEIFDDATKSSTITDSLVASEVFVETEKINGTSSTMRLSSSSSTISSLSSSSSSSSFSSLSENKGKLSNASVDDIVSTTAKIFVTENSRKFNSVEGSNIKRISPTKAFDLLESLGGTKSGLNYDEISGDDQHKDETTIGISENVEKNTIRNVGSFGKMKMPRFWQSLKKKIATSGRRREKALESTTHPDLIGSNITRLSVQSSTNNTESQEKFSTNFPPENDVSIEIVPDSTEELEPVINSAASVMPAVVQSDDEYDGKKQQLKEQLTQDGDFAFV